MKFHLLKLDRFVSKNFDKNFFEILVVVCRLMPNWTYNYAVLAFCNLVTSVFSDDERSSESIALRSTDPLSLFIYQSYIELTWLELILL